MHKNELTCSDRVGESLGHSSVGVAVGKCDEGAIVGTPVGDADGLGDGSKDGRDVGKAEGDNSP